MNTVPITDGQVEEFASPEAKASSYFDAHRRIIFINGMKNSGEDHMKSALGLSLIQMCTVVGVYNQSDGGIADLGQCIADKWQFGRTARSDGLPIARSAPGALDHAHKLAKAKGGVPPTRDKIMRDVLERNRATASLFDLLRSRDGSEHLFAHGQGNLILSNALAALAAVDGAGAISGRIVHSYGSPTVWWPPGIVLLENAFTWDFVAMLSGFDSSFSISKVGMPSGSYQPISHGFDEYMKRDPSFIINRFRWGSFGMTVSMDEEGLARTLADMGRNMPRVLSIFQRLERVHQTDVDDIALAYIQNIRKRGDAASLALAIKSESSLHKLLIRVMESGWTSDAEKDAIKFLKAL